MTQNSFKLEYFVQRRAGHVMVSFNKKLYLWGGYMEDPHENYTYLTPSSGHFHDPCDIWIYETLLNIWHRKICTGEIPPQLSGASAGVIGKFMYLFGGFHTDERYMNLFWQLDLQKFTWKQLNPGGFAPFPCDKSASWVYDGRFYIFGGYGPVSHLAHVLPVPAQFQVDSGLPYNGWFDQLVFYDTGTNKWVWPTVTGSNPKPRAAHAAAALKNKAYIFGGRHKELRMNDLFCLHLESHKWCQIHFNETSAVPVGRSWHTLNAISEDKLLVYGGFSTDCEVLYDVWVFDTTAGFWNPLSSSYPKRFWHCGASIRSQEVVYLGGISNNLLDQKPKDHAEKMLRIQFSPPSLFELALEYLSSSKSVPKRCWSQLTPSIQKILQVRTDPFELHGL